MKFVVFGLFFLFALGYAGNPIKPEMICPFCEFLVQVLEEETGDALTVDEPTIIAKCEKFFNTNQGSGSIGDLICSDLVKNVLNDIINALENTDNEIRDAKAVCRVANLCHPQPTVSSE